MKIVCLVENTEGQNGCIAEHGLSIYAETAKHKLLLDFGQTDAMLKNAEKLGIDITSVDTAFLSHGHYDHSGSLLKFAEAAPECTIYMQKSALDEHLHGERNIGIDRMAESLSNVRKLLGDYTVDDELLLFSGIKGRRLFPQGNHELEMCINGVRSEDDFLHEQCLVIAEEGRNYLLSGCAHNGILNILDRYYEIYGAYPYMAVTGFHMMKKTDYTEAEKELIAQTANELKQLPTRFVSGHCTGIPAFEIMKEIMGDQLSAMHSGDTII